MPILQASPFLERLLRFLIPYFTDFTPDLAAARAEAMETLASYGARTRAELLSAVQVIVFGFAALEALHEAKTTDMSPSMRLRIRGCANNLSRNGQKTEQILMKRLGCDEPAPTKADADPVNNVPEPQTEEILRQTQAEVDAYRNRAVGNRPVNGPQPPQQSVKDDNKRLWGKAMIDTLAELGMPVQPARET